jgi:hypothetical protein
VARWFPTPSERSVISAYVVELLGILIALGLLIFLVFRGFTLLLAAPAAAIVPPSSRENRYSPNGH